MRPFIEGGNMKAYAKPTLKVLGLLRTVTKFTVGCIGNCLFDDK